MIRRFAGWYGGLTPLGRARLWAAILCGLIAAVIALILRKMETPWEGVAPVYRESWLAGRRQWMPTEYYVQVYLWWAALINLGIVLALGVTSFWWVKRAFFATPRGENPAPGSKGAPIGNASLWILIGAIVLGGFLRIPLMQRPIMFDEQDNLRRNILGYTDIIADGEDKWIPAIWRDAFFENRVGNNPALFSVLSRGCLVIWRSTSGTADDRFHLVPFRLPSLVAGLLSFPVLWLLLRRIGLPRAANIAVLLFAIHPMIIDYHVQARGYAITMLFVLLTAWMALLALEGGRFRHWLGVAFSLVFALYSFSGSIYFYMVTTLLVFAHFGWHWLRKKEERSQTWAQIVKFALAMSISGMVFLQLTLPNAVQARFFLKEKFYPGELEPGWYLTVWSHYLSGTDKPPISEWWIPLAREERKVGEYITGTLIPTEPVLSFFLFIVAPVFLVTGLVLLWRKRRFLIPLLYAGGIAAVLSVIHSVFFTQLFLYYWYLIYALPLIVIALSAGADGSGSKLGSLTKQPWTRLALPVAFLVLFAAVSRPPVFGISYGTDLFEPRRVDFERASSRWSVHPDGTMTREKGFY